MLATRFVLPQTKSVSQRFLFDEDNQLPAKIIRAVIWSGMMIGVWAVPIGLLTAGAVTCVTNLAEVQQEDGRGIFAGLVVVCVFVTFTVIVSGALTGACASFYAGQEQPFWPAPSESPTFWRFCKRIPLTFSLALLFVFAAYFSILSFRPQLSDFSFAVALIPASLLLSLDECIKRERTNAA